MPTNEQLEKNECYLCTNHPESEFEKPGYCPLCGDHLSKVTLDVAEHRREIHKIVELRPEIQAIDEIEAFDAESGKVRGPSVLNPLLFENLEKFGEKPEQKLSMIVAFLEKIRGKTTPRVYERFITPELILFMNELENTSGAITERATSLLEMLNDKDSANGFGMLEEHFYAAIGRSLEKDNRLTEMEYIAFDMLYRDYVSALMKHKMEGGDSIARFGAQSREVKEGSVIKEYQLRFQETEYYRELGREILDRVRQKRTDETARMPYEEVTSATGETFNVQRNHERKEFAEVQNRTPVFVIGDTHGSYEAFEKSLITAGLITVEQGEPEWTGDKTKVVILGDIFDRGVDGTKILELIKRLDEGGRFVVSVGNHETILLQSAFGTVSEQTFYGWIYKQGGLDSIKGLVGNSAEYGDLGERLAAMQEALSELEAKTRERTLPYTQKAAAQKEWMMALKKLKEEFGPEVSGLLKKEVIGSSPEDKYGKLISNFKVVEQVDDVLYAHSEISPQLLYLVAGGGIDRVNNLWRKAFERAAYPKEVIRHDGKVVTQGPQTKYLDQLILRPFNDAFWSRLLSEKKIPSAAGRKEASEDHLEKVAVLLKKAGINTLVIGHTPSTLLSKKSQTEEGKKHFSQAEDGKQHTVEIGGVTIIFNDLALSPGVSKEEEARAGGVLINAETSSRNSVEFINNEGRYEQELGSPTGRREAA